MIVVLSGEGPSDLGCCANTQGICNKPDFLHGPMTILVNQEIESLLGYSPLESTPECYIFVSKRALVDAAQDARQNKKSMSLTGKKRAEVETGLFYLNALMLGKQTNRIAIDRSDAAIAVLFRDADGTRSDSASLWQDKVKSIRQGFNDAGLGKRGVPMVPKPKSESWMLCVLRDHYQHCISLEGLSGNDAGQDSAKDQLNTAMGGDSSTEAQVQILDQTGIDINLLADQMPSYAEFHRDIAEACREIIAS